MEFAFPGFSLAGRKALVTGASRGIGQALAVALAEAGADVAVAARTVCPLEETAEAIEARGRRGLAVPLDVADVGAVREIVDAVATSLGGLDILINNAGTEQVCPSDAVEEALWDRIVDTNLKGAFFCAQAAARAMAPDDDLENADKGEIGTAGANTGAHGGDQAGDGAGAGRGGVIINLASLTSEVGIPTAVAYGSSKTGIVGMTRALATEWAPLGIRVNAIGPGYFRTAMTEPFYRDGAWQQTMLDKIPLGRFGRLEDLAGAVVFLCSDAAAYITGQVLYIDGGTLASI